MDEIIKKLAQRLGFTDLETRRSDRHDFRSVAVWELKAVLIAAYEAGQHHDPRQLPKTLGENMDTTTLTVEQRLYLLELLDYAADGFGPRTNEERQKLAESLANLLRGDTDIISPAR